MASSAANSLEVELAIRGRGAAQYEATLLTGDDVARGIFKLPPLSEFENPFSADEATAKAVGSALYDAVFTGDLRESFWQVLERMRSERRRLRFWIGLTDNATELFQLPWEILYERRLINGFIGLSAASIVRSVGTGNAEPEQLYRDERDLRVLFASASPSSLSPIDSDRERATIAMLDRSGGVVLRTLLNASPRSLLNALSEEEPDVFHLAAHGVPDPSSGVLKIALEDGDGGVVMVAETELGQWLRECNVTLAVIMTSATPRSPGGSGAWGPLLGVPAAITMQSPITSVMASAFTAPFYEEFLAGRSLDASVSKARQILRSESSFGAIGWASPTLYASSYAALRIVGARTRLERYAAGAGDTRLAEEPAAAETAEEPADIETPAASSSAQAGGGADEADEPMEAGVAEEAAGPAAGRIVIGTLGGAVNDTVRGEDQLGFQHYVDAFADLITSPHAKPPLTIGIFGSWGMGKSFLLEHIESEISRREAQVDDGRQELVGPRIHIVRFNAWEYSATEVVWPGLVRKIVGKLDQDVPWPWYKRWWTRLKWNLPRELRRLWAPLLAAAVVVALAIAVAIWRDRTNLAAAFLAVAGALGVGGLIKAASDPIARWVTALFSESDYGRQIGYMEDIKHDLETLEARLHENGEADAPPVGRILILIDDLDRCEPEKAVEVLQAVNLLLNFNSFVVCLGIDARIVTGAVEKHYEGLLGRAGASGYEYLDKIVQIPFRIPEPNADEVKRFLAMQLNVDANGGDGAEVADEEQEENGEVSPPVSVVDTREQNVSRTTPTPLPFPLRSKEDPNAGRRPDRSRAASETTGGEPIDAGPAEEAATEPEAAVPFTRTELEAFEQFVPFLRPNPRHLKRLVNVYRLVRALARSKDERLILDNPAATIRWLVMWGQWPYTAHAMLTRFQQQLDEWEAGQFADDGREDPLINLLDAVEPQLDREIRGRLDDDIATLRDLLAVEGCALAWRDLKRIRKYTLNFNPAVEEQLSMFYAETGDGDHVSA